MRKLFLALVLNFVLLNAFAQSTPFFERTYGTEASDFTRGIVQTADSFLYVTGYSLDAITNKSQYTLYKLSLNGFLLWSKDYGDTLLNENAQGMLLSKSGELIVWGEKETGSGTIQGFVSRLDTSGTLLSTISVIPFFGNLSLHGGAQLVDSSLVFLGFASGSTANDILIYKCDPLLNTITQFTESPGSNAYGQGVVALPDSGFAIVADVNNGTDYDVWVTRYDKFNWPVWTATYGDTLQNGSQGIIMTSDGNLVVYGETEIFNFSLFDFFLQKIDMNGNSIWRTTSGGVSSDAVFSVIETTNGFVGTGYSNSFAPGSISAVVFETNPIGVLNWAIQYGDVSIDIGYQIIPSLNNGYYITGNSTVNGEMQCYLLHTDAGGWITVQAVGEAEQEIQISPNPSDGNFTVSSPSNNINSIELYSPSGQLVSTVSATCTSCVFQVDVAAGIYFLVIITETGIVRRKIVLA